MRAWLIGLAVIIGLAGCADNTAGIELMAKHNTYFLTITYWAADCWLTTSPPLMSMTDRVAWCS